MRLRRPRTVLPLLAFALLAVLRGHAETFTNPYRIPTSNDPSSVAVADLNHDGLLDIVYGDSSVNPQTIHVLLAQPDGGYSSAPPIPLPANVLASCRLFDTNSDGIPDLVCPEAFTFSASIAVFIGNGDGTFAAPTYFPLPTSTANYFDPSLSSAMDLNGDGIPDLLVIDNLNNRTFVLLGDGHGSFKLASTIGASPFSPIAIDVNHDVKPDLLETNGPYVALGNGDGTFGQFKNYSQAFDYDNVCIYADIEKIGQIDAVCGYVETITGNIIGATHLIILRGNPDGSFNPTPIINQKFGNYDTEYDGAGTFLYPIAIMDVNGDGILDIISSSADGYGVLLGGPNLTFAAPKHYAAGSIAAPNSLDAAFADMNGDGLIDIVASGPNGVYISYGRRDGSFATAQAFEIPETLNNAAFADFNHDGNPDIAATGNTAIQISLGNGDGTFAPFTPLPNTGINFSGIYPAPAAPIFAGDFNGDGNQDILALGSPSSSSTNDYLYLGHGDGSFALPIPVPNAGSPYLQGIGTTAIDVNNDLRDDVVWTGGSILAGQSQTIDVSLSNGDGSFRTVVTPIPVEQLNGAFNASASGPALADFNHDGKLDVVVGEQANAYVLKGHGDGTFDSTGTVLPIPSIAGSVSIGTAAVATGDFDGDGNQDVAVLYSLGQTNIYTFQSSVALFVYYGKGDGTFSAPVTAAVLNHLYDAMSVADLNGDKLDDIVLRNPNQLYDHPAVSVIHSLPGRTFAPEVNYTAGSGLAQAAIVDVNRDGLPDLLFANNTVSGAVANSVTVLLNQGIPPVGIATSVTLASSLNPSAHGQSVTFTATVTNTSSTAGTPTGTIVFSDGSTVLVTQQLTSANNTAVASFSTSTLAVGPHPITGTYVPTGAFAAATGTLLETITGLPADFTISLASPSLTIQTQHHLTTSVTLTSLNGFADSMALGCINPPTYVTCRFTPATATLTANGTTTISLYIDTDSVLGYARLQSSPRPGSPIPSPIGLALLLSPFGLFAAFASRHPSNSKRRSHFGLLILLLSAIPLATALTGCGTLIYPLTVPPSATPGTYTISIAASGATTGITHTTQLTLTVTP